MTLLSLMVSLGFLFLTLTTPFEVAGLFVLTLSVASLLVGSADSFLGFVVFVVYVGGALVLFSYCLMLTPMQLTRPKGASAFLPVLLIGFTAPLPSHCVMYDFYWVASLLLSVSVLLFIVMVCVVSLIDFSQGSMRVN